MGMAASQGRLLMMTARISNNEFEQQCVAYSKQRLADESQQANDIYLEALEATQYQIITGYHGDTPQYEAVSYDVLTGFENAAANKQYIVTDNVGKILVSDKVEKAFLDADFNFNKFLETVETGKAYTQIPDMDITEGMVHDAWDKYLTSVNRGIKDGIYYDDPSRHIIGFSYNHTEGTNINNVKGDVDYVTYDTAYMESESPDTRGRRIYLDKDSDGIYWYNNCKLNAESYIDEDGNTGYVAYFILPNENQEDEKIYLTNCTVKPNENGGYDFTTKVHIRKDDPDAPDEYEEETRSSSKDNDVYINRSEYYFSNYIEFTGSAKDYFTGTVYGAANAIYYEGSTPEQRELYDYAVALTKKYANQYKNTDTLIYDADKVQYYKNIYDQMIKKGYTTYNKMIQDKYINTESDSEKKPFVNDEWLIRQVKNGKLVISFYSSTEKDFINTTLDDDESIVNKENKSKMAIAEQVYQNHMDKIQYEDKRYDMELTKLESEHTALLTEYESVNKVISKNVEKSFGTFNA